MVLTGNLPGVSSVTVQALSKLDPTLRELHLTELDKISDAVVSRLLSCFPMLEVLVLRSVSLYLQCRLLKQSWQRKHKCGEENGGGRSKFM